MYPTQGNLSGINQTCLEHLQPEKLVFPQSSPSQPADPEREQHPHRLPHPQRHRHPEVKQYWHLEIRKVLLPPRSITKVFLCIKLNTPNWTKQTTRKYLLDWFFFGNWQTQSVICPIRNLLLIGEQGSAKTTLINSFFKKYKSDEHVVMNSNFSSTTTPQLFQKSVESSVDKRMGNVYGPPAGQYQECPECKSPFKHKKLFATWTHTEQF